MTRSSKVVLRFSFTEAIVPAWAERLAATLETDFQLESSAGTARETVLLCAEAVWAERGLWLPEAERRLQTGDVVVLFGRLPEGSFDVGGLAEGASTAEVRGSIVHGLSSGFACGVELRLYHSQVLQEWPGTCVLATPSGACIMAAVRYPRTQGLLLITTLELARRTMQNRPSDIARLVHLVVEQLQPPREQAQTRAVIEVNEAEINSYLLALYALLLRGVPVADQSIQEECVRLFGVGLSGDFWAHRASQHIADAAAIRRQLESRGLWELYGRRLFPV